ncbi:hypothetical protein Htur_3289 [Haloterrigena turkmenica DSM 5511]|uniref:Uncharacterized protein n=1 Tax=Haloterrigena turkmenica (strain ATCC 51198 / DSM 5511 / JCM 9101 / NCIMB 13204 / VKM B-1734 / 4k) TaxID=543526 RepID=D2RPK1_HALTV|nr:hypothetical protein [Haloterrigena turkmenica]ADB62153.1 hypothetical protein Htur_3289 [Haloterrigena turkmenica DSM 5511]
MTGIPALVARTEFRRTVRTVTSDTTKLLVTGFLALVFGGSILLAGGYMLPRLGAELADGVSSDTAAFATNLVTGGVGVGWFFLVFFTTLRAFSTAADPDEPEFLLTSTSLRNAVIGVIGAEILLFGSWLLPASLVLSGAFAYGTGTVWPVLVGPLLVCLALATAVPTGFVIGISVRHLVTVYEPIARFRILVFAAFWAAYLWVFATGRIDGLTSWLFSLLQDTPLGWPGHILLAAVPNVDASSTAILGGVVGAVAVSAVAFAVAIAIAGVHWFADPARFEEEEATATESSNRLADLLGRGLSRPVRAVTVTAIRRTKRAPIRLAYVAYPLFGSIAFFQEIVQTGRVPAHIAVILSVYLVWAAGALFTLNPLGDLGRGLPAVVASPLSGRQAITGLVVAGALVAGPIGFVGALALGLASPLSLERTAALAAGTTVGTVVTPALATGIGTAAPRFGSVKVTNNREAVMPSKTAFVVYSLAIILPAIAAVVLYAEAPELIADTMLAVSTWLPGPTVSVSARGITIAAWAVLVTGLIAPVISYLYAVERFDWYTLE